MNRKTVAIGSALILGLGLYIGNQTSGLSTTERDSFVMRSKNLIRRINRQEFEYCLDQFDHDLKNNMGIKKMQDVFTPALDALGEFQRFTGVSVNKHEKDGNPYTAAQVRCKYKNENAGFTILFNSDNLVSGIHLD